MHPGPLASRRRWLLVSTSALLALCFALFAGAAQAATDWDGDGTADGDCAPLDPAVHPGAVDKPDLSFEDTNCDGVDGDLAKAVWVSVVTGNDAAPGTQTSPKKTLAAAITLAASEGKDVYAMG